MSENSKPDPEDRSDRRPEGRRSGPPRRDGGSAGGGSRAGGSRGGYRRDDSRGGDSRGGDSRGRDGRSGDSRGGYRRDDSRGGDSRGGDSRGGDFRGRDGRSGDSRGGYRRDDSRGGDSRGRSDDRRDFRRDDARDDRGRAPRDEDYVPRPGTAAAADEPATPEEINYELLPFGVRAELKGLPKDLAAIVGAHILAAGELIDTDAELAYKHAEAARRRAGRLPVVREAAAETAYAAGHYDVALREYRALRRMNGGDEFLPVMADCERALGRPRDALDLLATLDPRTKDLGLRIECLLVEAGIRDDLGQRSETLRLLKTAISQKVGPKQGQARLRYAYANLLADDGKQQEARAWFEAAGKLDAEGLLDTTERIAEIDGISLPADFAFDEPEPDVDSAEAAEASEAEAVDDDAPVGEDEEGL